MANRNGWFAIHLNVGGKKYFVGWLYSPGLTLPGAPKIAGETMAAMMVDGVSALTAPIGGMGTYTFGGARGSGFGGGAPPPP